MVGPDHTIRSKAKLASERTFDANEPGNPLPVARLSADWLVIAKRA